MNPKPAFLRVDDWIQFSGPADTMSQTLAIRNKIHLLIMKKLRNPNYPIRDADNEVRNSLRK